MLIKSQVLDTIKKLPEKFSIDEVIERMILLEKIEIGIGQSDKGMITPDEELDSKLPKWLV